MKRITIGRNRSNDVVLGDLSVSRRHAELRADGRGRYFLIDLDSTNGTWVRDGGDWMRLRRGYVEPGERLQIGDVETTVDALLDGAGVGDAGADAPAAAAAGAREDMIDETPPPELALAEEAEPFRGFPADEAAPPEPAARSAGGGPRWALWAAVAAALVVVVGGAVFAVVELWDDVVGAAMEQAAAPAGSPGGNWAQTYGGAGAERGHALVVSPAGSLVVAATRSAEGADDGTAEPWLLGLAAGGAERWQSAPGGARGRAQALAALPDGSVLVAGSIRREAGGEPDGWVARLGRDSEVVWQRDLGGAAAEAFNAALTVDGGFVLAGTSRTGDGAGDGWLVKLDRDGGELWSKTIGGEGGQAFYALAPDGAGGFYAVGVDDGGGEGEDGWAVRLDAAGEVVWRSRVGGSGADYLVAVTPVGEGAVAAGRSLTKDGGFEMWVVWLDGEGAVTLERRLGGPGYDAASALAPTADGGVVLAGTRTAEPGGETGTDGEADGNAPDTNGWLVKLEAGSGRTVWNRTHGGAGADGLSAVAVAEDGAILAAGQSASGTAGGDDLWVLKLDAEGRL